MPPKKDEVFAFSFGPTDRQKDRQTDNGKKYAPGLSMRGHEEKQIYHFQPTKANDLSNWIKLKRLPDNKEPPYYKFCNHNKAFNTLPYDNILDWSTLTDLADSKLRYLK